MRIWIAGCSTGEEAFSIAIALDEAYRANKLPPHFKVFATDVCKHFIDIASRGHYDTSIEDSLSQQRLTRYFGKEEKGYVINNELRKKLVFARHNLLNDAPFTKIDLACCRNLLIYFNTLSQQTAVTKLSFALRKNGYLFLGASDSLGISSDHYKPVDEKAKIYRKVYNKALATFELGNTITSTPKSPSDTALTEDKTAFEEEPVDLIANAKDTLIHSHVPAALLVSSEGNILHILGNISAFSHVSEGKASLNIRKNLTPPLSAIVSAMLSKATKQKGSLGPQRANVSLNNDSVKVEVELQHIESPEGECYLFSFSDRSQLLSGLNSGVQANVGPQGEHLQHLENELQSTRESLQTTIEELETTNEELQATNEELMASNEEMQSSNEELQSVNEELNTVNAEFQQKVLQLNRINADLDNMSRATGVATLFLDSNMLISRFTPDATDYFKLRDTDIGRPIDEVVNTLDYPDFLSDVDFALKTGRLYEKELMSNDAHNI